MERFTQVVTVGGGFLMFYNPTMMGSATLGVGGGGGASKEWSKIRDERVLDSHVGSSVRPSREQV